LSPEKDAVAFTATENQTAVSKMGQNRLLAGIDI
jgi:hypothetical protein